MQEPELFFTVLGQPRDDEDRPGAVGDALQAVMSALRIDKADLATPAEDSLAAADKADIVVVFAFSMPLSDFHMDQMRRLQKPIVVIGSDLAAATFDSSASLGDPFGGISTDIEAAVSIAIDIARYSNPVEALITDSIQVVAQHLLDAVARDPYILDRISSRRFEELVAELLYREGWDVELTATTRDGGYDLFAIRKATTSTMGAAWVVECKRWRPDRKVGIDVVRALYGTRPVMAGASALLATTSFFTAGAQAFKAERYDLELRDRDALVAWIRESELRLRGTRIVEAR